MRYEVSSFVFENLPEARFGIIIGTGLKNSETTEVDSKVLEASEIQLRERIQPDQIKTHPDVLVYREALRSVGINPNKFMNSVEAMSKRIVKGGSLPRINALVDLTNAISLKHVISLGGHDLADIEADLEVRVSKEGDRYLPFGATEYEAVAPGELVFTSGSTVQTRQWLWRQSELGKVTLDSSEIFFQLVGFDDKLDQAMDEVEEMVRTRFGGATRRYMVDANQMGIEF